MAHMTAARYGKDNVRVCKVVRDGVTGRHTVIEMTVSVFLEGDIDTSYTEADNSVVVATDSMKNTIYILAKEHPVTPPELFASILATHFPNQYDHIHLAHVQVVTHRWTRMSFDGKPHTHSFFRDGNHTRVSTAVRRRGEGINIRSEISGLSVFKSTGSAFHGFIRDEYTTLQETRDRILSTDVDAVWEWRNFRDIEDVQQGVERFDDAWNKANDITLRTFANDDSASVQATMYRMAGQLLLAVPEVNHVEYSLPNKHYFEIDLSWHKDTKNTGPNAEVYAPQSDPNGLIKCRVSKQTQAKI